MCDKFFQGNMGFSSAGVGCGCSFFFELPLYSQPPQTPGLLPSSLELFSLADIEHEQDAFTSTNVQQNLGIISILSDASLKGDRNSVPHIFSADEHGSQEVVRVESTTILFDHVFQHMLLPPIRTQHPKSKMNSTIPISEND